jgi:hypothetical protein
MALPSSPASQYAVPRPSYHIDVFQVKLYGPAEIGGGGRKIFQIAVRFATVTVHPGIKTGALRKTDRLVKIAYRQSAEVLVKIRDPRL